MSEPLKINERILWRFDTRRPPVLCVVRIVANGIARIETADDGGIIESTWIDAVSRTPIP